MIRKVEHPGLRTKDYLEGIIEDCKKIQLACLSMGYFVDLSDCYILWSEYSDGMSASWLVLPESFDDIWGYMGFGEMVVSRAITLKIR
jgi:hypothetical protein